MKEKTKTKQANEDNNNKYNNYFPISPPPANTKSQEDQHFQSSSSPVGRPPPPPLPPPEVTYNYYQHNLDNNIFQDLSDIISQAQLSPRTPPSTPFMMMSMGPVDFVLDEFLDSSYPSDAELFPALPNNSNESS